MEMLLAMFGLALLGGIAGIGGDGSQDESEDDRDEGSRPTPNEGIGDLLDDPEVVEPEHPGGGDGGAVGGGEHVPEGTLKPSNVEQTGNIVSDEMFGGNVIYGVNTDGGDVKEVFEVALEQLGIDQLRYPAGKGDGDAETEGSEWTDLTKLELNDAGEWQLNDELRSVLEWARDPDDDPNTHITYKVKLMVPTRHLDVEGYEDNADSLEAFGYLIGRDYPDVVSHLEIGNEYYMRMGEEEYGKKANIAIHALTEGMDRADLDEDLRPDIIVQVGYPNVESSFTADKDDRGYIPRVEAANQAIIDQLDEEARRSIDGVVAHYYLQTDGALIDDMVDTQNHIQERYDVWDRNFDQKLDLHITEWNAANEDFTQTGMRSASIIATQFEHMVESGATTADVWPVQHNTATDLAGGRDGSVILDDQGRVVNSINGAVFDLMSESLPGTELLKTDLLGDHDGVGLTAYQSEEKTVIYVFSKSPEEQDFMLDLSDLVREDQQGSGVLVGIDPSSSDGIHYELGLGRVPAASVLVDDEPYYYNEHDVRALLTSFNYDSRIIPVTLKPYELLQISYV